MCNNGLVEPSDGFHRLDPQYQNRSYTRSRGTAPSGYGEFEEMPCWEFDVDLIRLIVPILGSMGLQSFWIWRSPEASALLSGALEGCRKVGAFVNCHG